MIKLEINRIPSQGLALVEEIPAHQWPVLKHCSTSGECTFTTPVCFNLRVLPEKDLVIVKGQFETKVTLACSRCLDTYETVLKQRFTLRFGREIAEALHDDTSGEVELTADQIGISYFEGEEIVLDDALQEQVILALPIKPLCRPDCKGLCQNCGADLNHEPCTCSKVVRDTPFSILKNIQLPTKE